MSDGAGGCRGARCCQDCINERAAQVPWTGGRCSWLRTATAALSRPGLVSALTGEREDPRTDADHLTAAPLLRESVYARLCVRKKKDRKERTQVLEWVNVLFYFYFFQVSVSE